MVEENSITAILLAGGKSSRMGTDKGLINFQGRPMIEYAIDAVKAVTEKLVIVTSNKAYRKFGLPLIEDIYSDCGPLGGIHAGFANSETDWIFVLGCDMPFLSEEFLQFLGSKRSAAEAIVPIHDGQAEPLCSLYHRSAMPKIESLLLEKKLKMMDVVKFLDTKFIEVPEKFEPVRLFRNINSPETLSIF